MGTPLKVLIIEDSEDDALLLLRELRRNGYEASHGRVDTREAMQEALAAGEWEVVLSDHVMPGFSGMAALEVLKESGLDLPFIIVSGKIGEDMAVRLMKAGAHDYVEKGNLARLVPAIEREMREAAERRDHRHAEDIRQQLAAIVESSDDVIIGKSLDGIINSWNKGAEKVYGYGADEAVGKPVSLLMPPERQDEMPLILERIRRGEHIEHYETERRKKDGSLVFMSLTISPIRDMTGRIVGASTIGRDISEQVRLRAELADKVAKLEAAMAKVKQLEGIIPICMYCKNIRVDKESWEHLETYITEHSEAFFSHGICPECFEKHFGIAPDPPGSEKPR